MATSAAAEQLFAERGGGSSGSALSNLTDDDKVIIRAAFGQGSLRNTSPEVAIDPELARDMGKLKGDAKLTTTNLRHAFGDAVDTDPQLNRVQPPVADPSPQLPAGRDILRVASGLGLRVVTGVRPIDVALDDRGGATNDWWRAG